MKAEKRNIPLVVRLTKSERASLKKQSQKEMLNMSEYVRRNIARPPEVTRKEYDDLKFNLLYEIRKIGVNINQIAKKYNEYRLAEPSQDLMDRMDELKILTSQVVSVLREKG